MSNEPDDGEVVVIRLEACGAFAVPLAVLDGYRIPVIDSADDTATTTSTAPVPLILSGDFLCQPLDRRGLAVDRYGVVHRTEVAAPLDPG